MGLERLDQVLGGLQQVHGSSLKVFGHLLKCPKAGYISLEENAIMTVNEKNKNKENRP